MFGSSSRNPSSSPNGWVKDKGDEGPEAIRPDCQRNHQARAWTLRSQLAVAIQVLAAIAQRGCKLDRKCFEKVLRNLFERDTKTLQSFAGTMQQCLSHCRVKSYSISSGAETSSGVLRVSRAYAKDSSRIPSVVLRIPPGFLQDSSRIPPGYFACMSAAIRWLYFAMWLSGAGDAFFNA